MKRYTDQSSRHRDSECRYNTGQSSQQQEVPSFIFVHALDVGRTNCAEANSNPIGREACLLPPRQFTAFL
jgi:hypothetical protein